MPHTHRPVAPPRPAALVNAEIRALWLSGGTLAPQRRARYEALLAEWSAAIRAEIVTAA